MALRPLNPYTSRIKQRYDLNSVYIFSGDATKEALALIAEEGSIYRGTVDLYPFKGGYESAKYLYEMATKGLPAEPKKVFLPYVPVPQEDVISGKYKPAY